MKYLVLTLYLVLLLSLVNLAQLIAAAELRWQLLPILFCHELMLEQGRQVIYQYQFLLELKGDDDQIAHLQQPLPSQFGQLLAVHQLQ